MLVARCLSFVVAALLVAGCAGRKAPESTKPLPSAPPVSADAGRRVVAHAQAMANAGKLHAGERRDCSGFVMNVYRAAGKPLTIPKTYQRFPNVSAMLHDWSASEGRAFRGLPAPGDLVFFRDTTGDIENRITHVALVERVREDGTVDLIHYISGRIRRDKMNLSRPSDPAVNAWLRRKKSKAEPALAGELFVAYARF